MNFDLLRITRENIVKLCSSFTLEQLNEIPTGFNNNLAWNAGHVVATQQLLTYGLCGQPLTLPSEFVEAYRKGSRPSGPIDAESWAFIATQLTASVDQLQSDWGQLSALHFKAYQSSYGVILGDLNQAAGFNQVHEGMHLGTMLAISKLIS